MAKPKHTPGPWCAQLNAPTAAVPGHLVEAADGRHPVALLWEGAGTKGKPRQIANAHLIAAAPDLAALARQLVTTLDEHLSDGDLRLLRPEAVAQLDVLRSTALAVLDQAGLSLPPG